jgi:protein TonB
MSSEEPVKAERCASVFSGCLVDGDAVTAERERKIKRRAIVISVVLQTTGLAALVIAPMFARPAELTERVVMPIPPYGHVPTQRRASQQLHARPTTHWETLYHLSTRPQVTGRTADQDGTGPLIDGPELPGNTEVNGPLNLIDDRHQPAAPERPLPQKKRMVVAHIDPAMLIRRIEPVYPALARQIRRSGKVELRAFIATDGTVQSLEVVSGDPLFVSSALEAVKQWRYKPTYLNGNPMDVDTYITVIYTLQQ